MLRKSLSGKARAHRAHSIAKHLKDRGYQVVPAEANELHVLSGNTLLTFIMTDYSLTKAKAARKAKFLAQFSKWEKSRWLEIY